tara:strand:+ start:36846 stop:37466 length:621 start_codon:yes stop_codon:yes gene_type:complete
MALSRTTKHLRLLVILVLVLEVAGIVLHFYQIDALGLIIKGEFVSSVYINKISDWSYWQFVAHLALYSFAGLFFLRWTYTSQIGAVFSKSNTSKSLKEVLVLWFIPFFNLFRPLQHIRAFSLQQFQSTDIKAIKNYRSLITIWWFLWLISGPVGRYLAHLSFPNESVVASYTYLIFYVFLEFLSIITAILFLVILGRQLHFIRGNK